MFIIFEKWGYKRQLLLELSAVEVSIHFIEYRLNELNNKHTKTASNSTIQFFESCSQKKYLVKFF